MKLLSFLFVVFFAAFAVAEEVIYLSALQNGNPPSLIIRKFARASSTGPYRALEMVKIPLTAAGGLTDLQWNGESTLHVYYTESQGAKARTVRETVSIVSGISHVSGSTKRSPPNLSNIINFDTNDAMALLQRVSGSQLHTQNMNPAGNFFGAFKAQPKFPFAPFGARISEGKPFFISALWTDPATGRPGITLQNVTAPTNARSFLFTNRVLNHDISLSFPRNATASGIQKKAEEKEVQIVFLEDDLDDLVARKSGVSRISAFVRPLQRTDFAPVGNVTRLSAPRTSPTSSAYQFNGIDIEPLATAIFYLRHNAACGSNEVIYQAFNPITNKKIGGPKVALPCVKDFIYYGLSSVNPKFKNGSTD